MDAIVENILWRFRKVNERGPLEPWQVTNSPEAIANMQEQGGYQFQLYQNLNMTAEQLAEQYGIATVPGTFGNVLEVPGYTFEVQLPGGTLKVICAWYIQPTPYATFRVYLRMPRVDCRSGSEEAEKFLDQLLHKLGDLSVWRGADKREEFKDGTYMLSYEFVFSKQPMVREIMRAPLCEETNYSQVWLNV